MAVLRGSRRLARLAVVLWMWGALRLPAEAQPASAQPPADRQAPSREYQIKAVFLFNFAQFVEWPRTAFATPGDPFVIGVLGDHPFGTYLDDTVRGERLNNRPMQVQYYRTLDEIKSCHILFISASETTRLPEILESLRDRSILTVSDIDDFVARGGMIRLALAQGRIRLIVNLEAAKAHNVTISSKLLRSAEIAATSPSK